jgi:putative membrane protein
MGFADVIPGVSGGTMALITGIYEELIDALESFEPGIILDLLQGRFREFFAGLKRIRYGFLASLGLGIGVALLVGSQFVRYLLEHFPPYTYSFFFGLILASAGLLYFEIPEVRAPAVASSLIGLVAAILIVGISSGDFSHGLPVIFASGAVAVCAMILPGISGAFILLLLGQYEYILDSIGGIPATLPILAVFGLGAGVGIVAFSRVLSFALENWRSATLGFLIGLMVGALRKPLEVLLDSSSNPAIDFGWTFQETLLVAVFGIIGVAVVVGLGFVRLRENRKRKG